MESIYPRRVPVMAGNLTGSGWTVASQESVLSLIVVLGSSVSLVGLIFAFITYRYAGRRSPRFGHADVLPNLSFSSSHHRPGGRESLAHHYLPPGGRHSFVKYTITPTGGEGHHFPVT